MKETTKMSRAVGQLEHIYNAINTDFFDGYLVVPIITVQSSPNSYGHCSRAKVWQKKDSATYELNISAETLNFPIEDVLDTMIHEMVHLYCREKNIKEVSRGGKYHNGKFKTEAEKRGLTCIQQGQYGWNTTPSDSLVEYAMEKGWNEIRIGRGNYGASKAGATGGSGKDPEDSGEPKEKQPSSTRKYQCPHCKASVRATKAVNIICGDCMVKMEEI